MIIEKNIPLPSRKRDKWKSPHKYPYKNMVIGDSFYVENYCREKMQRVTCAGRSYFIKMGKYDKMTVTARKESTGFRVWCVEKSMRTSD